MSSSVSSTHRSKETKQVQDVNEMQQMLGGGTAAIRTTSLPPVNGAVVANELSKFERNQAEIDAVKTKLEIQSTSLQVDETKAENAMQELLRKENCNVPLQIMNVQTSNNGTGSWVQVALVDAF